MITLHVTTWISICTGDTINHNAVKFTKGGSLTRIPDHHSPYHWNLPICQNAYDVTFEQNFSVFLSLLKYWRIYFL